MSKHSDGCTSRILTEQVAFEHEQRQRWIARVRRAATLNPGLSWELLAERFDSSEHAVRRACRGIARDTDLFAAQWNREHRRRAQ